MLGQLDRVRARGAAERIFGERNTHPFPPETNILPEWHIEIETLAAELGYRSTTQAAEIQKEFTDLVAAIASADTAWISCAARATRDACCFRTGRGRQTSLLERCPVTDFRYAIDRVSSGPLAEHTFSLPILSHIPHQLCDQIRTSARHAGGGEGSSPLSPLSGPATDGTKTGAHPKRLASWLYSLRASG